VIARHVACRGGGRLPVDGERFASFDGRRLKKRKAFREARKVEFTSHEAVQNDR
jgi:hypothetical protein